MVCVIKQVRYCDINIQVNPHVSVHIFPCNDTNSVTPDIGNLYHLFNVLLPVMSVVSVIDI